MTQPGSTGVIELTPFEFLDHRLSSWTGSPISSRRRGSTGIAITECLHRTTSCEKPSRRWRSGISASAARPLPAGMGTKVTPRKAAVTRLKTPLARHLPNRLGETHGAGGRGVSARVPLGAAAISGSSRYTQAGADPEGPHASGPTARAAARLAGPWPAHRLGRARPGPLSTGRFFRRHPSSCPTATSTASDGIPCHGADGPREERFQGRSAPTRKTRP